MAESMIGLFACTVAVGAICNADDAGWVLHRKVSEDRVVVAELLVSPTQLLCTVGALLAVFPLGRCTSEHLQRN